MMTLLGATMGLAALLGVWGGTPQDTAWDAWDGEAHLLAAERATGRIAGAPVEYLGLRVSCDRVIFEAVDPGNGDHADAAWDEIYAVMGADPHTLRIRNGGQSKTIDLTRETDSDFEGRGSFGEIDPAGLDALAEATDVLVSGEGWTLVFTGRGSSAAVAAMGC